MIRPIRTSLIWLKAASLVTLSLGFTSVQAASQTAPQATPQAAPMNVKAKPVMQPLSVAGGTPRTPAPSPIITNPTMSQQSIALKAKALPPAPVAPPVVYPAYGRSVTLAEAKAILAAAEAEALKNGWNMVITIVEPNGALVLSEKMDGAQYASVGVAEKKAVTAATFRRPTLFFQDAVKSGTLNSVFTGAMALEGGELIIIDEKVVGAIGVSGATGTQDGQVARAGTAIFAPPPPQPVMALPPGIN